MKHIYKIAFSFLLFVSISASAQKTASISLKSSPFQEFVNILEQQTGYRFYYRTEWTDSVSVTVNGEQESIDKLLNQALEGTDLYYSIIGNKVYVTKGRQLLTELPEDFFNEGVKSGNAVPFDYSTYESLQTQRKNAERIYSIGIKTKSMTGNATLSGHIKDIRSGEALVGATIYAETTSSGTTTDQFGRYSLTLPKGRHKLLIKNIGMRSSHCQVILYNNGKLDLEMEEEITSLKEVIVQSDRDKKVMNKQMGVDKLDIKTMKQMPLALGEADVMKVILALPGVQSVGEGTIGLNVRGGATNQNLILFNDAVVYNPSHLFGFFSSFNPDVLKSAELYKSGITADYGGRLSSVLDVQSREGNLKKFSGSGGISPITGRFTFEGPIIKEKASFLVGFRSTYSDWILGRLDDPAIKNSEASFYDLTANISHKINDNNSLQLSGYMSKDKFKLNSDTTYHYSDRNASIKWKHRFSDKLFGIATGTYSQYIYSLNSDRDSSEAFNMDFSVRQFGFKADLSYSLNSRHTLSTGASTILYGLSPGSISPVGDESLIISRKLQHERGLESAVYVGDDFDVNDKISFYFGLRYSIYQYLGERDVFVYAQNEVLEPNNIIDTLRAGAGQAIATYHGLEPRLNARVLVSNTSSVKFSYNRTRQYIQMLSNTTAITPTDIWKLSDTYIKPQIGDQVSLGYYKNLRNNTIEASVEAYYKIMQNTVDYKGGAVLLLNNHIETDVVNAKGKAYGIELLFRKTTGKLNGWISYAYSRSLLQTKSKHSAETINRGKYYPSNFDKPHAVNFIGNYRVNRRLNFSLNLVYSTGRPITLPIAKYYIENGNRIYYSDRNAYRIPDYFRSDISLNIEGNHKIKKLAHSSWTFAVYNLTGRRNAYSVFFVTQNGQINGYKLSVFGQPIPTITYNFKF